MTLQSFILLLLRYLFLIIIQCLHSQKGLAANLKSNILVLSGHLV